MSWWPAEVYGPIDTSIAGSNQVGPVLRLFARDGDLETALGINNRNLANVASHDLREFTNCLQPEGEEPEFTVAMKEAVAFVSTT